MALFTNIALYYSNFLTAKGNITNALFEIVIQFISDFPPKYHTNLQIFSKTYQSIQDIVIYNI